MKIAHIADVHLRLKDRHAEYIDVFKKLIKKLKEQKPDRILLAGDIVHSKITMSPELIVITRWFLKKLEAIAPVDIIAGNHDLNLSNADRLDALTPVIETVDTTGNGIHYYKKTGVHQIGDSNFHYGVMSLLDGGDLSFTKKDREDGHVYIALYHGVVSGSKLENGYMFDHATMSVRAFSNFDFTMLGDIHRRQFLDDEKRVAYPGSLVQQNFGEDMEKGFLMWDIKDRNDFSCEFVRVYNDYAFATVYAKDDILPDLDLPEKCRMRVIWEKDPSEISRVEVARLNGLIRDKYNPYTIQLTFKPIDGGKAKHLSVGNDYNFSDPDVQRTILKNWFKGKDDIDIDTILELDKQLTEMVTNAELEDFTNSIWSLKKVCIENFMSYGKPVVIDFENMAGIIGLFGDNASGKSVIIDAIMYALFNKITRNVKNEDLVNKYTNNNVCRVILDIKIRGVDYRLERWTTRMYQKRSGNFTGARTDVILKRRFSETDEWENLSETQRNETEKIIRNAVGSFDDFLITTLSTQTKGEEFINQRPGLRSENMLRFLGLDVYSRKYELAKDMSKTLEIKMRDINTEDQLESLEVTRTNLEEAKKELDLANDLLESKEEEIEKIQTEIGKMKEQINGSIKLDQSLAEIEAERKKLELEIEEIEKRTEEYKKLIQDRMDDAELLEAELMDDAELFKLQDAKTECEHIESQLKEYNKEIESDKRLLKLYRNDLSNGNTCPVSDDERHKTCPYLTSFVEKKEDCITLLNTVEGLLKEGKKLSSKKSKLCVGLDELEKQEELREEIQNHVQHIESMSKVIGVDKGLLETKQFALKLVKGKLKTANENSTALENNITLKRDISTHELNMSKAKSEFSKLSKTIVELESNIAVFRKEIVDLEERMARYEKQSNEYSIYNHYMNAIHRDAIPAVLLREYIPLVNYEINQVLGNVVDFGVFMTMDDGSNDLNIVMRYDNESIDDTRPAQMASGMERLLINMAIRYALISITQLNKPNAWIIDEGFGVLDVENLHSISKFFENVRSMFKNIIIITHIDALKDIAQWVINIEKKGGISVVNDPLKNI